MASPGQLSAMAIDLEAFRQDVGGAPPLPRPTMPLVSEFMVVLYQDQWQSNVDAVGTVWGSHRRRDG